MKVKLENIFNNLLFYIFITVLLIALDLYTKVLIEEILLDKKLIVLIPNLLNLHLAYNYGIAFGLFSKFNYVILMQGLAILILLIFSILNYKRAKVIYKISFCFIFGGGLGNFIDRLFDNKVIDFIDFYYKVYHFPSFNFADIFINIGLFLIIVYLIKMYFKEKTKNS